MLRSKCDLKMHVRNLGHITLPLQIGSPKLFPRLRNLTATLAAYVFRMKHGIDNGQERWQLSYIV